MLFYITQLPTLYEHRCQRPTHTVIHKCNSSMFWTILWIATILPAILAACTQEDTQNANQSTKCKAGKCSISLGAANNYCSQCSAAADYLIDGECIADNRDSACTHQDEQNGTCKPCAANYFLYKGGCYKVNSPPGNLICSDVTGSTNIGTCDVCAVRFFKNLEPTAAKQACIACNETEIVDGITGAADCIAC